MDRTASPDVSTSLLEPDLDRVARLIGGPEAEAVARELLLVQRTRGKALLDGRVSHRETREWVELSNEELDETSGAAFLVKRRVHGIPRLLGCEFAAELFPPPVFRGQGVTGILGVVRDLCSWRVIPAFTADPEDEFDGPLPMGRVLSTEGALAWSGLSYSALARARRVDVDLIEAVEVVRGICFYRVRPFLRWLQKGRKGRA